MKQQFTVIVFTVMVLPVIFNVIFFGTVSLDS